MVVGFILVLTVLLDFGQKIKAQDSKLISVTIIDNGLELKIKTSQNKVENILNEAKIKIANGDLIFPNLSSEIDQNYKILIYRLNKSVEESKALKTYIVQPGDTVSKIAKKFGLSWNTIKWANNLESADQLQIGKELVILPVNGIFYTISPGDTLKEISLKYQGNEEEIIKYNQIIDPQNLMPGEKIIIPGGKITETPKVEVVTQKTQTKNETKSNSSAKTESKKPQTDQSLTGTASWYNWKKGMGCACLKFPKGTRLKVTNLKTGASVEVVVNDSGPYNSRIIDLTQEAFLRIAPLGSGVVKVKIEKIK